MRMIWATRGLSWGFRFLRTGNLADPLPTYSSAFASFEGVPQIWNRSGDVTVLRFEDPLGRQDRAGRVIPHDFVILDDFATRVDSIISGRDLVWPIVEAEYARNYASTKPT